MTSALSVFSSQHGRGERRRGGTACRLIMLRLVYDKFGQQCGGENSSQRVSVSNDGDNGAAGVHSSVQQSSTEVDACAASL